MTNYDTIYAHNVYICWLIICKIMIRQDNIIKFLMPLFRCLFQATQKLVKIEKFLFIFKKLKKKKKKPSIVLCKHSHQKHHVRKMSLHPFDVQSNLYMDVSVGISVLNPIISLYFIIKSV